MIVKLTPNKRDPEYVHLQLDVSLFRMWKFLSALPLKNAVYVKLYEGLDWRERGGLGIVTKNTYLKGNESFYPKGQKGRNP